MKLLSILILGGSFVRIHDMRLEYEIADVQILVVDDDSMCCEAVKRILGRYGAKVVAVSGGELALEQMNKQVFDLIIADIQMPSMDGIELLGKIRTLYADIPVILFTGYGSVGTAVEALHLGAQDYLLKPLENGEKLLNAVTKCIGLHQLRERNRVLQNRVQQSEETLHAVFQNANDGMFLHAFTSEGTPGPITEVNERACRRLGLSRENIVGCYMTDLVPEQLRVEASHVLAQLGKHDSVTFETSLDGRQGPVAMEIGSHAFNLRGSRAVISIAREITERRSLALRITDAAERERRMIGRDLHDVLCQDLTSVQMLASVLKATLATENSKGAQDAAIIADIAIRATGFVRRLAAGMFPVELENYGLSVALESLALNQAQIFHVPCTFHGEEGADPADKGKALYIYRIAQEAVVNAVKHGQAGHIAIRLGLRQNGGGVLTIEDDGVGIGDRNEISDGMGLHIMKYLARMINASLDIAGRRGEGTRIRCEWK
jgi:PAS domain S-box-containing protein